MKNVFTLLLSLLILCSAEAQKPKKPNINKAKSMWNKGMLDEAKAMIDNATTYEKTMNNGKTWYYRGLIYATIDTTSVEAFQNLDENALEVAMESFEMARKLDTEGNGYVIFEPGSTAPMTMDQQVNGYYGYYFGLAAKAFEAKDMKIASEHFETASKILPTDTSAIVNAAYSAQAAGDNDRAFELFGKSLDSGAKNIAMYLTMIYMLNQKEDYQGALDITKRAKKLYPGDPGLSELEVSVLLKLDKVDEAMVELTEASKNDPNNPALLFSLALLYDQTDREDEAVATYKKALEIDPNHYESNYNLGVISFSGANEIYKELTQLTTSATDRKKEKELLPVIQEGFKNALPYWEKVHEVRSDNMSAIQTLSFIYNFMKMEEKADEMEKKMDALEGQ